MSRWSLPDFDQTWCGTRHFDPGAGRSRPEPPWSARSFVSSFSDMPTAVVQYRSSYGTLSVISLSLILLDLIVCHVSLNKQSTSRLMARSAFSKIGTHAGIAGFLIRQRMQRTLFGCILYPGVMIPAAGAQCSSSLPANILASSSYAALESDEGCRGSCRQNNRLESIIATSVPRSR
jgi:hypothetical protein